MSWQEQVTFQWNTDDDDVSFVPDQHAYTNVGFFIALADWYNSPQATLSWFLSNQSLLLLTKCCVFMVKAAKINFIVYR